MTSSVRRIPATYEVFDDRFGRCRGDDWWEHHFDDGRWTEGPLYLPASRALLFSDIPNDRALQWNEYTGLVTPIPGSANYANGRTVDGCGRVLTCEQGTRRVVRTEHDGSTTILADRFDGARFNSPNDVVVAGDGAIWFTDPSYGIDSDYEGVRSPAEIAGRHVYRIDASGSPADTVAADFEQPNGLAFSTDGQRLFIVDSGRSRNHIRRFEVGQAGGLSDGHVIVESSAGQFDGIRIDTNDNIWAAAGDGVHHIDPDGNLLGKIHLPEPASNLTFGGLKRNRLFVTATRSLYSILLRANGARTPASTGRPGVTIPGGDGS